MSDGDGRGFVANSLANLLVGAAALGYAVIVPAVVLRRFGADLYGTWYLAFQVTAYVLVLDLGSQYLVTNEVAIPSRRSGAARLATAAMITQSALAFAVLGAALAWAQLTGQATLAGLVVILGAAAVVSLLASTVRAWFGGLQRAHVPAVWLVGARAGGIAGMAWALATHRDLVTLTIAVVLPQVVVHAALLVWARRPPSPWARPDRAAFIRLLRYSSPLALWTASGILIAGVDIFIVRAVDPSEVAKYAIALPLLAVTTGVVTAAMAAWLPRVSRAEASEVQGGRDPSLAATTVMAAGLSVGAIPFVGFADEIIRFWAGSGRWGSATTYLRLLYLASCLRFVFVPWSVLILARGEQSRITLAPLTEAGVNVTASVLLGLWLGAVGVALGTLAGAAVAAVLYLVWAVPRTDRSGLTAPALLRAAARARAPFAASSGLAVLTIAGAGAAWRSLAAALALGVDAWWFADRRGQVMAPPAQSEPR